jgi:antitoxin component HigA of HigAB toxin-antitoxin module
MIEIYKAINAINPTAQFRVTDEDVDSIVWLNETTPIDRQDILDKQAELQTAYDAEQWKRNRQKEYPDAIECVHALLDGGDTLTDLQAKRTAVKDKYSKP